MVDQAEQDVFQARITGSRETVAGLMQEFELDVGCRGTRVEINADGTGTFIIYAPEERIRRLQAAGHRVEIGENVSALGRERQREVGEGDRFQGGRIPPRGLGEKRGRARKEGSTS